MFELTRWSPFGSMFQMHRELDDLFGRFLGHEGAPTPYRSETAAGDLVAGGRELCEGRRRSTCAWRSRVSIPRTSRSRSRTTDLTIRGERKAKTEQKDGGRYVREFAYGSFERSFALPDGIDPGKVQAKFTNGMLDLTLPAPVAVVPKKVEIQIEGGAEPGEGHQGRLTRRAPQAGTQRPSVTRPPGRPRGPRCCSGPEALAALV